MRIDSIIVVCSEWLAFLMWLFFYRRIKESRYRLFALYLGVIAIIELLNLFFHRSDNGWSNWLVMHVNVPLQFLFFINFLLFTANKTRQKISISFSLIYLAVFLSERFNAFERPVYFDSFSYGLGCLLLIISVVISLFHIFKKENLTRYNQTALFWILMGLILFYIGSLPYNNFRNFFWSKPAYYNTAYFLHYLSQFFCTVMYLLFAYALRWKIK